MIHPLARRKFRELRSITLLGTVRSTTTLFFYPQLQIHLPHSQAPLLTTPKQHIATTSPNEEILRFFLSQGASVHLRNRAGHTPLFLAAQAKQLEYVKLLREAGGHLHNEELSEAKHRAKRASNSKPDEDAELSKEIWNAAGVEI